METTLNTEELKVGIIGVGKIGSILARILSENFPTLVHDIASVPKDLERFAVESSEIIARECDIILICVKPKDVLDVLSEISSAFSKKLIVSVAAGIRSELIRKFARRWARLMPNVCAEQKEGVFAILAEHEEDSQLLKEIFSNFGKVFIVRSDEEIDIFTATSASGPGYISDIFETFEDAFVRSGLSRDVARTLSAQVFIGTAKRILAGKSPSEIKAEVMTPAGTTAESLTEIVKTKPHIFKAVERALEKSKQISQILPEKK